MWYKKKVTDGELTLAIGKKMKQKTKKNNRPANNYYVWKLYANIHDKKIYREKYVRQDCLLSSKTNIVQKPILLNISELQSRKA